MFSIAMTRGPAKQFDRDQVLEKAMELFWAQGYEATGMAQLTEHMGIGRQSLYDTFGDKRTLLLEALRRYADREVGPMLTILDAPGSPMGNIRRLFASLRDMPDDGCGCLVGNCVAEFGDRDPEVARLLDGYLGRVERAFRHAFERAQKEGELAAHIRPADLACSMIATMQGVALLSKVRRDPGLARSVIETSLAMLGPA